ncbi:TPA: pyruvate kinase [Legionella pneumophila]|uniref:Pyruvate kinase n=2 Tax=Legionella pneumophila TaxID=446 RepID=Q5ZZ75_LEGPH|nr:pyruvate kinase [Legionella pneumophila]WBV63022.1 pyruvate kinase [Legionella pneumophila 130b]AAU26243.1 pyruvate kinase II [Legionella pneumophila subsp. pneumophila str. Philadelphia 1]AEW50424.1 pyruvate kinase II [Legionella pneumophila subsp. pneumophila ATCC 43290]AGH55191.1 Pyruvate kinase [Legionella pneumophila subsp. pneumophila LPE509]AGN13066.1 pyruvate kinase II [Legionella pneumophila subsp. pneumophila str. Thunder Bay]
MLRRTKIVATLGPASKEPEILRSMLAAGVNVVRINFSHADSSALQLIALVRKIADELNHPVAVMADLQGPKIRVGRFQNKSITLIDGQNFTLDCMAPDTLGDINGVSVAYPNLANELSIGDHLLINDGLIELEVIEISGSKIHCKVVEGGVLTDLKGLNRKGGGLAARTLTEKDRNDLRTAIEAEVDYISLSFVKDAEDIRQARALMKDYGAQITPIIAKIERMEALDHLTDIIREADAIMVARGDLGVEVGAAEVPAIQKHIIEQTRLLDKVVITATQMMESMISNPQPTRAEVSDVANAILDGTDAVMLSAETASGLFPVKVITMVNKICLSAEKHASFFYHSDPETCHYQRADQAIAMATMHTANHFPIQAIITLTESGDTALWVSRHHSTVPIFAISANKRTIGRLSLVNNVFPIYIDFHQFNPEGLNQQILHELIKSGHLEKRGYVLLTRGTQIGMPGGTNCMEIIPVV